jgi:MFS family permease
MKQRLAVILNISLVSGCVIMGVTIISPVLPQYASLFSVSIALAGWAISAFGLARVFTDIPAGFLSDRLGRKKIMILGLALIIISSTGAGLADTYAWLIFARIVGGVGSALYMTAGITWVAQISAGEARGRYMAVYQGLLLAGTVFGPPIGGYTAARFGLNAPFFTWAILGAASLIATLSLKDPADSSQVKRSEMRIEDVLSVFKNHPFMLVNCAVLALYFLRLGVQSTLVPFYADLNLGLPEETIGILLMVAAIATAAITFPAGWLSDRVGRKRPVMACLFLSGIAVLLIPSQGNLAGLMGIMVFYGLATGLQGSIAAWPADVAPKDKMGISMGVYRVMMDMGIFLGPITTTYIADYTGDETITFMPFLVPVLIVFAVGVLMIWAKDPARRRRIEEYKGE